MTLYRYQDHQPELHKDTFVAPSAVLIGRVHLSKGANVWYGAVLRGDNEPILIGESSNIQENSVLHTDMGCPLNVGSHVTVGHSVTLHGCTIGNNSLIGMGATILNRAVIGHNSIVGAGALVTEGKTFPDGSLIIGSPAKLARALTNEEIAQLPHNAAQYVERGYVYKQNLTEVKDI
ncbi:gamma carbonic anhydrase family protein [Formosimonas limnophila]|uniref:Gamma carbonic anhydrase family protein n=1 Tax=Formosimonas limnophila TaxID=1384487 RepID=A0A8J3FXJ9_9BURK|nr:gamma carbonic anhydrase family protein [Formosimonas limnophila]GHA65308.1 gamma carbonic anhydrase family protein [Formosimonas limnophila]